MVNIDPPELDFWEMTAENKHTFDMLWDLYTLTNHEPEDYGWPNDIDEEAIVGDWIEVQRSFDDWEENL